MVLTPEGGLAVQPSSAVAVRVSIKVSEETQEKESKLVTPEVFDNVMSTEPQENIRLLSRSVYLTLGAAQK